MTQDELIELLRKHEWRDVEFKEAQRKVPRDAYETVSAFANTEGGHLVFGVRKSGQEMEIVGVLDVDKVQNEFLSTLRQPDKISVVVDVQEDLHKHHESDLLIFYVPEVHLSQKPVYLNGDIRRAFVRSGGSDVRCSDHERERLSHRRRSRASRRPGGRPESGHGIRPGHHPLVPGGVRVEAGEPLMRVDVRHGLPGRNGSAGRAGRPAPSDPRGHSDLRDESGLSATAAAPPWWTVSVSRRMQTPRRRETAGSTVSFSTRTSSVRGAR